RLMLCTFPSPQLMRTMCPSTAWSKTRPVRVTCDREGLCVTVALTDGTFSLRTNGCAFAFPRWGSDTVTPAFPSSARKLAGTVAFRWRELTKVVASGRPLNSTVDWFVKSLPLTVSVKPELPSAAEAWLRLVTCGVNADVTVSPVNEKAPLKVGGGV